jgi:hypothetical protein
MKDGAAFMRRNLLVTVNYYRQSNRRLHDYTIRSEIVALAIGLALLGMAAMYYLISPPV